MAGCSRCGKKASGGFVPASSAQDAGSRPRPALRQRPVTRPAARQGRFGDPIQPAQQPQPPSNGA